MKINLNVSKRGESKIIVSHSDLDGIGCVVLAEYRYGAKLNWYCTEYGNVNERVHEILDYIVEHEIDPAGIDFIISDISVDNQTAERLHTFFENGMKLRLYDHHASATALNAYPWAIVDITECGTTLVYLNELAPIASSFDMFKENHINVILMELAYTVKDYDLWQHTDVRSSKLNRLLSVLGRDNTIARLIKDPNVELTTLESILVEMNEQKEDRYFKRVSSAMKFFTDERGRKFAVSYCDQFTSNVAHRLLADITINYVVLVDVLGKKVSLRSKFIDVSRIAEKHGGGGHKYASGFQFDPEVAEDLAEVMYA